MPRWMDSSFNLVISYILHTLKTKPSLLNYLLNQFCTSDTSCQKTDQYIHILNNFLLMTTEKTKLECSFLSFKNLFNPHVHYLRAKRRGKGGKYKKNSEQENKLEQSEVEKRKLSWLCGKQFLVLFSRLIFSWNTQRITLRRWWIGTMPSWRTTRREHWARYNSKNTHPACGCMLAKFFNKMQSSIPVLNTWNRNYQSSGWRHHQLAKTNYKLR